MVDPATLELLLIAMARSTLMSIRQPLPLHSSRPLSRVSKLLVPCTFLEAISEPLQTMRLTPNSAVPHETDPLRYAMRDIR